MTIPRRPPEQLDPLEEAIVFAIREAARLRRERTAGEGDRRAKMTIVEGGKGRGGRAA